MDKITTSPTRIQRSRQHKQVSPNELPIVYVGRGSRWGNPFRVIKHSDGKWTIKTDGTDNCNELVIKNCHYIYNTKNEAVIDAIECYKKWLLPYNYDKDSTFELYQSMCVLEDIKVNLRGKNLSCWCRIGDKCHADFLLELANI